MLGKISRRAHEMAALALHLAFLALLSHLFQRAKLGRW
jgi:hypothetical protein